MTNYLLAGGGTAGHVNPLLSLADFIVAKEPNSTVLALGTSEGLEAQLVPDRGYQLATIAKLPFPRKPNFYALKFPSKFLKAVKQVRRLIRDNKIDVVVGFGGYASAPAYVAARQEKIRLVLHEANALPGIANRIGIRFADAVATTFKDTPLAGAIQTGMPLRKEIESVASSRNQAHSRKHFGLEADMFTLLVTGGSLGAKRINDAVESARDLLLAAGIQVLHIVGGKSDLKPLKAKGYLRMNYCDRMDLAMDACDFAVSRAGASTVAELTAIGIPALYLPYSVGNGEQAFNLREVTTAGGGLGLADAKFDRTYIASDLVPLLSSASRVKVMADAAKSVGILNGTERLYQLVSGVLSK